MGGGGKSEVEIFKFYQGGVYVGLKMLLLMRQVQQNNFQASGVNIFQDMANF